MQSYKSEHTCLSCSFNRTNFSSNHISRKWHTPLFCVCGGGEREGFAQTYLSRLTLNNWWLVPWPETAPLNDYCRNYLFGYRRKDTHLKKMNIAFPLHPPPPPPRAKLLSFSGCDVFAQRKERKARFLKVKKWWPFIIWNSECILFCYL